MPAHAEAELPQEQIDEAFVDELNELVQDGGRVREFTFEDEIPSEKRVQMSEEEMLETAIAVFEHDYGFPYGEGEVFESAQVILCGPESVGCFIQEYPNVCCDWLGMTYGQAYPVGETGSTITCYD